LSRRCCDWREPLRTERRRKTRGRWARSTLPAPDRGRAPRRRATIRADFAGQPLLSPRILGDTRRTGGRRARRYSPIACRIRGVMASSHSINSGEAHGSAFRWAVMGLYFYDERAADFAAKLTLSSRGELEITDLNLQYLENGELNVVRIGRGCAWLTPARPIRCWRRPSSFARWKSARDSRSPAPRRSPIPEGWISRDALLELAHRNNGDFGAYLRNPETWS
jgi:hypothetical protein